jgi:protein-disulfide isomerase
MAKKRRRKLTRTEAKAEAERRQRQRQITWAIAGIVVVAVIVVLILITIGGQSGGTVAADPLREDVEIGVTDEGYPYRGPADAPVTVINYADYNCPHCGAFAVESEPLLDEEFVATGRIKYVAPPYALWEESIPIVEAAVCATEQGGFWDYHQRLFANQAQFSQLRPPSRAVLIGWAKDGGLDEDVFNACLNEGRRDQVLAATEKAKLELGVNSTPTFFVNGVKTQLFTNEAPIDTLRKAIEAAEVAASGGQ